jgi:hypothetical protein
MDVEFTYNVSEEDYEDDRLGDCGGKTNCSTFLSSVKGISIAR